MVDWNGLTTRNSLSTEYEIDKFGAIVFVVVRTKMFVKRNLIVIYLSTESAHFRDMYCNVSIRPPECDTPDLIS